VSSHQPPPSNQPPYGQPPPPPPGQPAPPGPPPPYGPPPEGRKSNTALIAIVTIVVLALVGGAAGGILLLGGDDDSESADGGGGTIEGNGYSYAIPEGWDDATEDASGTEGIDSAVRADDDDGGFRSNVLVEVQPAAGASDPQEIRAQWEANIGGAVDATPEQIASATIDGQEALGVRVETEREGISVVQYAYLAINEGQIYSIAMSANLEAEDEATEELNQLLDSWSWT
jgi:PsbP